MADAEVGVLFVCTGNICRSPTAHGVFEQLVAGAGLADRVRVDSAGTMDYHPGRPPDPRSQRAAARRGYSLGHLRARQLRARDYRDFDLLVAMDHEHVEHMRSRCGRDPDRIRLLLEFAPGTGAAVREVPDPYYGGEEDFERVLDLVEPAARGLLDHVRTRWSL